MSIGSTADSAGVAAAKERSFVENFATQISINQCCYGCLVVVPWPEDADGVCGVAGCAGDVTCSGIDTDGGVAAFVIGESVIEVGVAAATVANGEGTPIDVGVRTGLDGAVFSCACKFAMAGVSGVDGGSDDGGLCNMNAS